MFLLLVDVVCVVARGHLICSMGLGYVVDTRVLDTGAGKSVGERQRASHRADMKSDDATLNCRGSMH